MRTPKTINIISEEKQIIDYDALGNPIYDVVKTYEPINCDVEPFSKKLAEESYGIFVDATNRVFSKPNKLIKLQEIVEYRNKSYEITEIIEYDKHFETLLNYVGDVNE